MTSTTGLTSQYWYPCTAIFLHREFWGKGVQDRSQSPICSLHTWNTWFDTHPQHEAYLDFRKCPGMETPRTHSSAINLSNLGRPLPILTSSEKATWLSWSIVLLICQYWLCFRHFHPYLSQLPRIKRTPTVLSYPNSLLLRRVHPRYLLSVTTVLHHQYQYQTLMTRMAYILGAWPGQSSPGKRRKLVLLKTR